MKGVSGEISIKQKRHVAGGTGGVSSIDRTEEGASPASATSSSLIVAAPSPGRITQDRAKCSRDALAAAICVGNTVRAFSNRYQAQISAQSVVRMAVARLVLSTSETARFARRGSVRKPRGPLTRLRPQRINVAPQLTPFVGSRSRSCFDGLPKRAV